MSTQCGYLGLAFRLLVFGLLLPWGLLGCESEDSGLTSAQLEKSLAGSLAPDFTLRDLEGREVSLSDFRGKTVLLNFWATWCAPCIAEMPALERLHQQFQERSFLVLGVSTDFDPRVVSLFQQKQGLSFPIVIDQEIVVPKKYGVSGFPESFFIGPDGTFLAFHDPSTGKRVTRIISDRPWDSPSFFENVNKLLTGLAGEHG